MRRSAKESGEVRRSLEEWGGERRGEECEGASRSAQEGRGRRRSEGGRFRRGRWRGGEECRVWRDREEWRWIRSATVPRGARGVFPKLSRVCVLSPVF